MKPFQDPHFTVWNVIFSAIGAAIFWGRWGKNKLRPFFLADFIDLLPANEKTKDLISFLLFVALGCVVTVGVVQPTNVPQAFSGGLGWTGLAGQVTKKGV